MICENNEAKIELGKKTFKYENTDESWKTKPVPVDVYGMREIGIFPSKILPSKKNLQNIITEDNKDSKCLQLTF